MSVLRKKNKYTTIGNDTLLEKGLPLSAKGLLLVLLHLHESPINRGLSIEQVSRLSNNTPEDTRAAAEELEQHGLAVVWFDKASDEYAVTLTYAGLRAGNNEV